MDYDVSQTARFLQAHKARAATTPPSFEPLTNDDIRFRCWNVCLKWIHSAVDLTNAKLTDDDDLLHRALCLFGRLVQIEIAKSAGSIEAIPLKTYMNMTFVAFILALKWTSKTTRISDIVNVLMTTNRIDDAELKLVRIVPLDTPFDESSNASSDRSSFDGSSSGSMSSDESCDTSLECSEVLEFSSAGRTTSHQSWMHASYITDDGQNRFLGYFCDKRHALWAFLLHKYSHLEMYYFCHLRGAVDVVVGPELARDLLRLMFSDHNYRHFDQKAIYNASVQFLSIWRHDPNLCNLQVQVCAVAACERAIEGSDVASSGMDWRTRWDHDVVPHLLEGVFAETGTS